MDNKEYWRIYATIADMMPAYGLIGTDRFIDQCVNRVLDNAGLNWNEDDVKIAIRNTLNELIEKCSNVG